MQELEFLDFGFTLQSFHFIYLIREPTLYFYVHAHVEGEV